MNQVDFLLMARSSISLLLGEFSHRFTALHILFLHSQGPKPIFSSFKSEASHGHGMQEVLGPRPRY